MQGDFGTLLGQPQIGREQIGNRLGNTLFLAFFAAADLGAAGHRCSGCSRCSYRNRCPDKLITFVTLAAISLPEFFVGYLLILFFAVKLAIAAFPATVYDGMSFGQQL